MPAKGTTMRKITQIIRLHFEAKLSTRQIAASLKVSVGVVSKYVNRALDLKNPLIFKCSIKDQSNRVSSPKVH